MRRILLSLFLLSVLFGTGSGQPFTFVHITDTHVGGATGADDLREAVRDINTLSGIDFVILTGDVTEFGSRDELEQARRILDGLQKPWYAVPGNHDAKWSESGCNDFVEVFGAETFSFEKNGILFIGTASGPNMRMAPALMPREQILWLDSLLSGMKELAQPVVFINHYPLDESMSNSGKIISLLKSRNIQVSLMGHGHTNKQYNFEGIPGVMGRSALRAGKEQGGYNIVTLKEDTLYYTERVTGVETLPVWCKIPLNLNRFHSSSTQASPGLSPSTSPDSLITASLVSSISPDSSIQASPVSSPPATTSPLPVRVVWEFTDDSDIGAGIAVKGNLCVYTRTDGHVIARALGSGEMIWKYQTGGKVFSTPVIRGNRVVSPSTDGHIRCFNLRDGNVLWDFITEKPIVASSVIKGNRVFTGSSEGVFRSHHLRDGRLLWHYDSVSNFVETRPLLYRGALYFGSWGNTFYALDQKSGKLLWKREKYTNRMLSPAAVWPVASHGKIFIVAPDRRMTALEAVSGREIWDSGKWSCRESIGISSDKREVIIKNMLEGNVMAFDAKSDTQKVVWECLADLGYEIAPSPVTQKGNMVFVPTTSGIVVAIDRKENRVAWRYQIGEALVNHILPVKGNRLLITTFDGKVACLEYKK